MLRKTKERLHTDVVRCDAQALPFRDKCFDTSYESSCLYLVGQKRSMLEEMARVARKRVIVFESNRLSPRRLYNRFFGKRKYADMLSPSQVKKYIRESKLSPRSSVVRMVGFAPLMQKKSVLKLWGPVESFIEACPVLRLFAGGILAVVDLV